MEFMHLYIEQGRFDEFVEGILEMDYKRRKEEEEKEEEHKLWTMYIHSMSDKSFIDWKKEIFSSKQKKPETYSMTDAQVEATLANSRGILKSFSPV